MKQHFYIEGTSPLPQWMNLLSQRALVRAWSKKINPMGVYSHYGHGDGVVLELQQILQYNKYSQTIERLFQLKPSVKGTFHIDESAIAAGGELTGMLVMVQMLSAILAMETGAAILLSADHDILLLRREGLLLLNADSGFWTPSRLAHIRLPYERRPLPTPLRE
jgi:hypothetical protein